MAASDLVQLAELKTWLGITSNAEDDLLQALITQISSWADGYTNRTLYTTTYTLVCDGKGEARKNTPNWPVTAVASIVVDGVSIPASPDGVQPGYVFDPTQPRLTLLGGYRFCPGVSNVKIVYTAGYTTFPLNLVLAAKQLVTNRYRGKAWAGKTSQTGPAGQASQYYSKDEATPEVLRILDSYRRVTPW